MILYCMIQHPIVLYTVYLCTADPLFLHLQLHISAVYLHCHVYTDLSTFLLLIVNVDIFQYCYVCLITVC